MTHYEVLQVSPTASTEIITMAYQILTEQYRSDIYQGDRAYAAEKLKQIEEAYRVLASPDLRRGYDRLLQIQREKAQKVQSTPPEQTIQSEQTSHNTQAQQPEVEDGSRKQKKHWSSSELWITFMLAFLITITILSLPALLQKKSTQARRHRQWKILPRLNCLCQQSQQLLQRKCRQSRRLRRNQSQNQNPSPPLSFRSQVKFYPALNGTMVRN